MNRTSIEWVKNPDGSQGYTWNPITGCLNGCSYCYARKLAKTRLKERYLANTNVATPIEKERTELETLETIGSLVYDPFYPRFWPDRLDELAITKRRLPESGLAGMIYDKGIFVCDMSDLFGIGIPEEWTYEILRLCRQNHKHRFYLLTKQPQNLQKFSPFPDNCWVGMSVTHRYDVLSATAELGEIEAKVKYISFEPLLDDVSQFMYFGTLIRRNIDWIIIGAQTKPYKPPKIEWVREIIEACDGYGISVFLKDNLGPLFPEVGKDNQSRLGLVAKGKLRQEMP